MVIERVKQFILFQKIKKAYTRYERFLMPATLITGLIVDFLTFRSIQISSALLILGAHFLFAGMIIAYRHLYDAKRIPRISPLRYLRLFSPLLLQFSFGALLSASFIFYWFSGTVSVSWPFILLIALLMVSNDVVREFYLKPTVQIGVYYFITISIFALILPFLFNSIAASYFLIAGGLSLLFIVLFIKGLTLVSKDLRRKSRALAALVISIFLLMNAAYFLNLIPPIPLSLQEAGVYHGVKRSGTDYLLQAEKESLLARILPGQTIHWQSGKPIYVYSSVFAPANLRTPIVHHWQYYDERQNTWISKDKLSFAITGGRKAGYRGYTLKSALQPGKWRVSVETQRGQVLGRIKFRVQTAEIAPELEQVVR